MGRWAWAGMWASLSGCSGGPEPYPLDDVLTFAHLQAVGTHNSYHVQTSDLPAWAYNHAPLALQLDGGVRQFELDVSVDAALGAHRVFHVPLIDEGTTCALLTDCIGAMAAWSNDHPGHHPLLVMVETKDPWSEAGEAHLDLLEAEIAATWPEERLLTPARVTGTHPDLRTALEVDGWPVLGELRGHALFVLHDGGPRREAYLARLADARLFPDAMGDAEASFAAFHSMNDPFDPAIETVVGAGHLVRTRSDVDTAEAQTNDTGPRDQAFASGAHFVSTDFPAPVQGTDYWVAVPDGVPSRCNPLTAPQECTPAAVESPGLLMGVAAR